ncbi:SDR family NAD(P)-dependent oxidoreductase [Candidatus Nanohalovita haloferacivicina]|uniref:SDR family NAD(P)-dependent oxidoreductase n=1 Tax=Candidatus Nanohalovita haloferacivicina TaxID=2978046 RepID=UPI00325FDD83|nr:Glucose 1-dehydrogenase [Candidatus Nanohalobia archaeon BNXNv]
MNRFEGRTAIVTGSSSGIGRAIAQKLGDEGANVVVADVRREPNQDGRTTHEMINEEGGEAVFIETDVSDEESVQDTVFQAAEKYGQIDVLVNNAGIHIPGSADETDMEDWRKTIEVNLDGQFLCSKHVIDHMLKEDIEGDVVNIASIAGIVGYGQNAAYCASKGGVVELTREMALDYGPEGINVNSVSPGVIRTAMTEEMLEDEEQKQFIESNTVSPRVGEPEDIANAVAFLASSESNFVTGENLVVDGGWTAH